VVAIVTHDIVEYRIISHPGIRGVGAFAESQLLPTTLRALRNPASFPHGMAGSGRFRGIPIVTHDIVDIAESRIIFPLYGGPPAWVMKREWDFFPKVPPGRVELSAAAAAAPAIPAGNGAGFRKWVTIGANSPHHAMGIRNRRVGNGAGFHDAMSWVTIRIPKTRQLATIP